MRFNNKTILRFLTVCISLVFVSGCSLLNPHIRFTHLKNEATIDLNAGLTYANGAIEEYRKAIGTQAYLSSITGTGLILTSAAALGMGISGGDTKIITALGLTGASGYGIGTMLNSKPRQLVYASGIKAIICAKEAVLPMNLPRKQFSNFSTAYDNLNKNLVEAQMALNETNTYIDKIKNKPSLSKNDKKNIASAESSTSTAKAIIAEGNNALDSANKLSLEMGQAGQKLISAVDKIAVDVDTALVKTETDLQSVPGIVGALAQMNQQITKIPGTTQSPEVMANGVHSDTVRMSLHGAVNDQDINNALFNALFRLKAACTQLSATTQTIASIVNAVAAARPATSLKQCGIDIPEETFDIKIDPPGDMQFTKNTKTTKKLVITGGKPPYTTTLLNKVDNGPVVTSNPGFGTTFVEISVETNTVPDVYNIYIMDSVGKGKTVTVKIQ